ncbi:hypothetical protein J6Q66_01925 [bacterium]|nr:hypothetical protein [bacterium]
MQINKVNSANQPSFKGIVSKGFLEYTKETVQKCARYRNIKRLQQINDLFDKVETRTQHFDIKVTPVETNKFYYILESYVPIDFFPNSQKYPALKGVRIHRRCGAPAISDYKRKQVLADPKKYRNPKDNQMDTAFHWEELYYVSDKHKGYPTPEAVLSNTLFALKRATTLLHKKLAKTNQLPVEKTKTKADISQIASELMAKLDKAIEKTK